MSGESLGDWHEWPFEPLEILRVLCTHRVEYVLIGGLAAVLQGSPIPTYDIDVAPAPSTANGYRLQSALTDIDAVPLTDPGHARRGISQAEDGNFYTAFGFVDVHHLPAGFKSYAELRRNAIPMELEPDLVVLVSPLRDIIRSRTAAGDYRQLPALEAALELAHQDAGA